MADSKVADYLVIGGGAAGCVLANRLSADPANRVALLEAGGQDADPRIHDPSGFVQLWGSDIDWKITTQPQPGLSGRQILINQGRVIGGSSSIHAMMYVRGNPRNYDCWNALGNDGWSYADVLPYFKRSEDYEKGASEFHGAGGPLSVRDCPDDNARSPAFMNAAVELGYDGPGWDYNGARQEDGAGPLQFSITRDSKRSSAAVAFLRPALGRPNLEVRTGAEVSRVLFEGKRAVGVEYRQGGQTLQARAAREVILCAGAFLSPKLLMLSGIGPADRLRGLGIPVVEDLPGVGQNLQDHLQLPVVYRANVKLPQSTLLTGNVLFTRTRPGMKAAPPDLQLNFIPTTPGPLAQVLPDFGGPVCIFLPILVQAHSIGSVGLRSADPQDPPVVNPNYLQRDIDVQVFVRALEIIRALAHTQAFADFNNGELAPGLNADLEAYIRNNCSTLWHPAGTCRMGRDALAVVDPELRVYGAEGLRVADASVMPAVTSGNTYAPCIMIAGKAADLVLEKK